METEKTNKSTQAHKPSGHEDGHMYTFLLLCTVIWLEKQPSEWSLAASKTNIYQGLGTISWEVYGTVIPHKQSQGWIQLAVAEQWQLSEAMLGHICCVCRMVRCSAKLCWGSTLPSWLPILSCPHLLPQREPGQTAAWIWGNRRAVMELL